MESLELPELSAVLAELLPAKVPWGTGAGGRREPRRKGGLAGGGVGKSRGCSRLGRKVSLAPRSWPPEVATAKMGVSPRRQIPAGASVTRFTRTRELCAWRRIAVWMLIRPGGPKALGLGTMKTSF